MNNSKEQSSGGEGGEGFKGVPPENKEDQVFPRSKEAGINKSAFKESCERKWNGKVEFVSISPSSNTWRCYE